MSTTDVHAHRTTTPPADRATGGGAQVTAVRPPRISARGRAWRQRLVTTLFLGPAVIYMVLFFGYPVIQNLIMGFQHYTITTFFTDEAPWAGWTNYTEVLGSPLFRTALANTVIFTVGSILGQFVLGLGLALFFRRRFPLSGALRSLILLPWLIPLIVASAVWKWLLDTDSGALNRVLMGSGLIDSGIPWLSSTDLALFTVIVVNIWIGIPFNAVILHGGLQTIPQELYEAGSIDGTSRWQAFRHITWPMLRPVVSVVLVLGVVYTLKVLDIILGLTGGGPANATQTLATQAYQLSFATFDFGQGAAVSNILILISLLFAVIYLRLNRRPVDE
ncbi:sugar ABC transporter permease [Nesterenkonia sp. HG001]|uniref:carbohydrate ABC transporter permease n=1 Tax=Nesterenkonia sp. HG001 TaxID=2983207 RepID=UPI002AC4EA1C|nr:sugar ABC transporter permease [Nesterenkonia sp. HG001]MDZ5078191.1 sugar ABC transporter permease [Nesterenkonia sp. HG001]